MKAVIIKGLELPEQPNHLVDLRIYGDGTVQIVGCMGKASNLNVKAEEVELEDDNA